MHKILAINPGSTSTKAAVFDDDVCIAQKTVSHSAEQLKEYKSILEQRQMRTGCVLDMLAENSISMSELAAIVGRGGLVHPIDSGTYIVNTDMLGDLEKASALIHASALGGIIAYDLAKEHGLCAYVVDPIVVDEMEPRARLTGIPRIERRSVFHALNTKAVARKAAKFLGSDYESSRFVVAHLGGGISVGAHRYGRVIDVNDTSSGEGPYTPERCGSVPISGIIDMCFSGNYSKEDMMRFLVGSGGFIAYLGTNDMRAIEKMVRNGDEYAALVMDSMAYQVSKEIGAMVAALEGRVDAIVLTGGLSYSGRFTGAIRQSVDQIAKVLVFPGEEEMKALAGGVLRVLTGREQAKIYES